jgi:DNA-binding XRE family transcriptional regulator
MTPSEPLGATIPTSPEETPSLSASSLQGGPQPLVMPFQNAAGKVHPTLTPVVNDDRALARLLEVVLARGGFSVRSAAQALGVTDEAVRQYTRGRRSNPSIKWFLNLCQLCGCKVFVSFER